MKWPWSKKTTPPAEAEAEPEVVSDAILPPPQPDEESVPERGRSIARALDPRLVAAINRFGFRLLRELIGDAPTDNLLISPASVSAALSMTYNGAAGETAAAMAAALCLEDLSLDDLNRAHTALWAALASADPQVTFEAANSLWARLGSPFLPDFMARNQEFYGAEVTNLNFSDPGAAATINAWVARCTHGKIPDIVEPPIDPLTILFLINALYFKGQWSQQFDPAATKPGIFHLLDGGEKACPMMAQSGKYPYLAGPGFQAVSLPYGAGRFSLVVVLPAVELGLAGFLERLSREGLNDWNDWMDALWQRDGALTLPRFKIEYGKSLNAALSALGMGVAFSPIAAEFSAMYPDARDGLVWITDVRHKTFMEVNEEGTVAAAVTKVEMGLRCVPPPPFEMIVDRPFFCAIRDNETGVIVFAGVVVEPE